MNPPGGGEKGLELCGMEEREGRAEKTIAVEGEDNTPEEEGLTNYSTCEAKQEEVKKRISCMLIL